MKNANTEAAVNLEVQDGKIRARLLRHLRSSCRQRVLKLKDQTLLEEQIAINPAKAYRKEIALPAGADVHDLRASLSADGKELVAYSPVRLQAPAPAGRGDELPAAGGDQDQ